MRQPTAPRPDPGQVWASKGSDSWAIEPLLGVNKQFPIPLSGVGGVTFLVLAILLNALLAILGSLLWGFVPYWPAYMVYVLAAVYFGRWGVALAIISPAISSLLLFRDIPFYLYMPVNLLQVCLALLAFRLVNIHPALITWLDRFKYLVLAVILPSFTGGCVAWLLRSLVPTLDDGPLLSFAALWALENLLPAILPGLWLHGVIGDAEETTIRTAGSKTWMRKTLDYTTPWMLSLAAVALMLILVVARQVNWETKNYNVGQLSPDLFRRTQEIVKLEPEIRLPIFMLTILMLYALGSSVKHAKQSWMLGETVRRYLPNRRITDFLMSGLRVQAEQCLITVVVSNIQNFESMAARLSPTDLLTWLSNYFSRMCAVSASCGGSVVEFTSGGLLLVFGLTSRDTEAPAALECGLRMLDEVDALNQQLAAANLPPIQIGIGMNTGRAIAGEIGSSDRSQYTVIGPTVNIGFLLSRKSRDFPDNILPLVCSRETLRDLGLLRSDQEQQLFLEFSTDLPGEDVPESHYAVRRSHRQKIREWLTSYVATSRLNSGACQQ